MFSGGGRVHSLNNYIINKDVVISKKFEKTFEEIITLENVYKAWRDFIKGKRKREDVNNFAIRITDNLFNLYTDLISIKYNHGLYDEYIICDPKKRVIHKASVRDRVVHRLIYNSLYNYFDNRFIYDSYSCRIGKGTHRSRDRFRYFVNKVSKNYIGKTYVLKFDVKKCFESVNQSVLKELLAKYIADNNILKLTFDVIDSFPKGLPLGNLTSQLFINIYIHELDIYCKHVIGCKYYIRYADDVVVVSESKEELEEIYKQIEYFIKNQLDLTLHKKQ